MVHDGHGPCHEQPANERPFIKKLVDTTARRLARHPRCAPSFGAGADPHGAGRVEPPGLVQQSTVTGGVAYAFSGTVPTNFGPVCSDHRQPGRSDSCHSARYGKLNDEM